MERRCPAYSSWPWMSADCGVSWESIFQLICSKRLIDTIYHSSRPAHFGYIANAEIIFEGLTITLKIEGEGTVN
jgi:hypothetical protein